MKSVFCPIVFFALACVSSYAAENQTEFTVDGVTYTVINEVEKTVSTKAGTSVNSPGNLFQSTSLDIPASVLWGG